MMKMKIFNLMLCCAVISGCAIPANKSPSELKSDSKAFDKTYVLNVDFDKFMANNFEAMTKCKDSLRFNKHPTEDVAVAMIQPAGLTGPVTILYAEAKRAGEKTNVDVWLYFNYWGWKDGAANYLRQIEDPSICVKK